MSHRFDTAVLPRNLPPLQLTLVAEQRPSGGITDDHDVWAVYTLEQGQRDMWLGDFGLRAHAEAFIQMLYENDKA